MAKRSARELVLWHLEPGTDRQRVPAFLCCEHKWPIRNAPDGNYVLARVFTAAERPVGYRPTGYPLLRWEPRGVSLVDFGTDDAALRALIEPAVEDFRRKVEKADHDRHSQRDQIGLDTRQLYLRVRYALRGGSLAKSALQDINKRGGNLIALHTVDTKGTLRIDSLRAKEPIFPLWLQAWEVAQRPPYERGRALLRSVLTKLLASVDEDPPRELRDRLFCLLEGFARTRGYSLTSRRPLKQTPESMAVEIVAILRGVGVPTVKKHVAIVERNTIRV